MNVTKYGNWESGQSKHRIYRTHPASSVVSYLVGRKPRKGGVRTFTTLDVRLDGILWKQGSWRKNWKERFFVLRRDAWRLSYYESKNSLRLLGEVVLVTEARDKPAILTPVTDDSPHAPGYVGFAVTCAATGRELRLQASSVEERDKWLRAIRSAIDHALKIDHNKDIKDDQKKNEEENNTDDTDQFIDRQQKMRSSTSNDMALGLQATLHLTHGGDTEDGLFLVVFVDHGEDKITSTTSQGRMRSLSPPDSYQSSGRRWTSPKQSETMSSIVPAKNWRQVARTETVKPGDSGAFACERDDGGLDVVRQFSILLPRPRSWGASEALLCVYRRVGDSDKLSKHTLLMHAELSREALEKLGAASCGNVVQVKLEMHDVTSADLLAVVPSAIEHDTALLNAAAKNGEYFSELEDDNDDEEEEDEEEEIQKDRCPPLPPEPYEDDDESVQKEKAAPQRRRFFFSKWNSPAVKTAGGKTKSGTSPSAPVPLITTEGRLLLMGVEANGLAPRPSARLELPAYARQHYHLRCMDDKKQYNYAIASEAIGAPSATMELPAAMIRLLISERETARNKAITELKSLADEKHSLALELRRQFREQISVARECTRNRSQAESSAAKLREMQQRAAVECGDAARALGAYVPPPAEEQGAQSELAARVSRCRREEEAALARCRDLELASMRVEILAAEVDAVLNELGVKYTSHLEKYYEHSGDLVQARLDNWRRRARLHLTEDGNEDDERTNSADKKCASRGRSVERHYEDCDDSEENITLGHASLSNPHVAQVAHVPIIKRSTQKKDRLLQIAPTNTNWHQLRARKLLNISDETKFHEKAYLTSERGSWTPSFRSSAITSFAEDGGSLSDSAREVPAPLARLDRRYSTIKRGRSQSQPPAIPNINHSNDLVHSTITFGVTAAHAKPFGFKEGGLARLLDKDPAAFPPVSGNQHVSSRLERCLLLHSHGGLDAAALHLVKDAAEAVFRRKSTELGSRSGAADTVIADDGPHPASRTAANALSARLALAERVDVVLAQALGLAGAHLDIVLSAAANDGDPSGIIQRAVRPTSQSTVGRLLIGIECLLSTLNDEQGMLEDLIVATEWLSTVRFRFLRQKSLTPSANEASPLPRWTVRRAESGSIIVDALVEGVVASMLATLAGPEPDLGTEPTHPDLVPIATTRLDAVLFSQGINEWQTMANNFGTSALQTEINAKGLEALKAHVERASRIARELALEDIAKAQHADQQIKQWQDLLKLATDAVKDANAAMKNVHVLLTTADLCRSIVGSHCICCKSGKDRTSMAVTLEQTRALSRELGILDEKHVCKLLRRHGIRRVNVLANTHQDKYAFNALQVSSLPRVYRPPKGTYSGSTAT
mmetsp:Transcript_4709/g.7095  ORF Transcript_4709/g.7095 Transcript_4709/m.7095 type:complete len:1360 (-) Transcript_4709:622-4701(-)